MKLWIIGLEDRKYWAAERTGNSSKDWEQKLTLESAYKEAELLMMKHPIRNDMSRAEIVSDPRVGFGIPILKAPHYIDYSVVRKTPQQVWIVKAPTRYQAIKIARQSRAAGELPPAAG